MYKEQEGKTRKVRQLVELLQYEYNEREKRVQIEILERIHKYTTGGICHVTIKVSTQEREFGIKNKGTRQYKYVYTETLEREMREDIEEWYKGYFRLQKMNQEISIINTKMLELTGDIIRVQYEIGKGYREITDRSLVIGINQKDLEKIKKTGLFCGTGESEEEKMTLQNLRNWLKYAITPVKLIKIKEPILEDLCIYTRRTVHTVIRGTVDMRVQNVVNREELYEDKDIIAIVKREIRSEDEIQIARRDLQEGKTPKINLERVEELPEGVYVEYKYKLKPIYKSNYEEAKVDAIKKIRE